MTSSGRMHFHPDTLRQRAGDRVFARGEAYYENDHVRILVIEPTRVLAHVSGSEDYRTELIGRGRNLGGQCSCPAYEDWGFCKHMVAVGLAANAVADDEVAGGGTLVRIRDHLKAKGVDALADLIVMLAEQDIHLFRKLELEAATSQADDTTVEARLGKAVDDATRLEHYIDYASLSDWIAEVDEVLGAIEALPSARAELAFRLAERVIDRIEQGSENIDDPDGQCGELLERAADIHLAAAAVFRPEPVQFAQALFKRDMKGDGVAGVAQRYAEVLGEDGLAEYRRLAEQAWQKMPAPRQQLPHDLSFEYDRLVDILDSFAERDGDTDARIALRAKNLSSPWRYLELAEFCWSHGRKELAIRYVEEGLWVFEDGRQDRRLILLAVDLFSQSGRSKDAEAHLWRLFEREPSLDLYGRLRELGGDAARSRALQTLERRCAQGAPGGWPRPADLLVAIHLQSGAFSEAWISLDKFGGSSDLKRRLAEASERTHGDRALAVYQDLVELLAGRGSHTSYGEAVALIRRMAKLRGAGEQAAYLAALRQRHGRKRNFMKLLE